MDELLKIKELEDELSATEYNKATQHHFAIVKARIAKLREKHERKIASKKAGEGFAIKKSGDATVVLLGFPSVGKSTLLNNLTNAKSRVAAYEFTTLEVVPGTMHYNNAKIQILDVPGIITGAATGRGRGREVLAMVRNADLLLVLVDALHPEHYPVILKELYDAGIRINKSPPDIKITKKIRGGIQIGSTVPLTLDKKTIESVLAEFGIRNADVVIRSDIDDDGLIDAIEGNRKYIPAIVAITKIDLVGEKQKEEIMKKIRPDIVVSAEKGTNINELKELIFNKLGLIRIYLKEINKNPDLDEPMVLLKNCTVRTVCERIHRDFVKKFRFCRIWGKSAKFPGQQFRTLDKQLEDGDIVEIHVA